MVHDKNIINVTAIKNIQHLKTFFYWCAHKKRNNLSNTDFADYKFKHNNDIEVIYLTNGELMRLYHLEIEN